MNRLNPETWFVRTREDAPRLNGKRYVQSLVIQFKSLHFQRLTYFQEDETEKKKRDPKELETDAQEVCDEGNRGKKEYSLGIVKRWKVLDKMRARFFECAHCRSPCKHCEAKYFCYQCKVYCCATHYDSSM
jgi:hypothetical protein